MMSRKRSLSEVGKSSESWLSQSKRQKTEKAFTMSDQWLPQLNLEEKKQCHDIANALYNLNQSSQFPHLIVQEIAVAAVGMIQRCHICDKELLDLQSERHRQSFKFYEPTEYPQLTETLFYCRNCSDDPHLPRCDSQIAIGTSCHNPCRKAENRCKNDICGETKCPLHSDELGYCDFDGCETGKMHFGCLQICVNCDVVICWEHWYNCRKFCDGAYCPQCFFPSAKCDLCYTTICNKCQSAKTQNIDLIRDQMSVCRRADCPSSKDNHSICKQCNEPASFCRTLDEIDRFARAHSWLKCSEEQCIEKVCCFGVMDDNMTQKRFEEIYKPTMKENQCRRCTKLFCNDHINYNSGNNVGYCAVCISLFET